MEKTDKGIPISLGTALLSIVLLCFVFLGLGLGAGFYFGVQGTREGAELSPAAQISDTCRALSRAYEGRIAAERVNQDILMARVAKYETFLVEVGVQPTLPVESLPKTAMRKAKKKLGVGGPY